MEYKIFRPEQAKERILTEISVGMFGVIKNEKWRPLDKTETEETLNRMEKWVMAEQVNVISIVNKGDDWVVFYKH